MITLTAHETETLLALLRAVQADSRQEYVKTGRPDALARCIAAAHLGTMLDLRRAATVAA